MAPGTYWWIAIGLAALASALTFDPKLYINGDNVDYMFLARDVRGGNPWPSEKYPPLFPWLLAPVQAIFGMALIPQKILVLAFYCGSLWMISRIVRRRIGSGAAPWVFFSGVTLIPVIEYSHYVMSEVPYLFFLAGAIDSADRVAARNRTERGLLAEIRNPDLWTLAVWLGGAFYTRSAAAFAIGGLLLALSWSRGWRASAALILALAVICSPWILRAATREGGSPYVEQWLRVNPYYPELGRLNASALIGRIRENASVYFLEEIPVTVAPVFYRSTYSPQDIRNAWYPTPVVVLTLIPLAVGLCRGLRRADTLAWVVVTSLIGSCLWPPIWAGTRFLVPIVPFVFLVWWEGLDPAGVRPSWRSLPLARSAGRVLLGLWLLLGVKNLIAYADETRVYPPHWGHYFSAIEWIRDHAPADAIVLDRKPAFVEFGSGRRAVMFPREADPDRMLDAMITRGVTHVILASLPYDDIYRYLEPTVKARAHYFRMLEHWPDPEAFVASFDRELWLRDRSLRVAGALPAMPDSATSGAATGIAPRAR